jgi:integrase
MANSTDVRALTKLSKPCRYTIPNAKGLHLWVRTDQKKYWIYRFTFQKQRIDMSLGTFPEIQLREARLKAIQLRAKIINGVNPMDERRDSKEKLKKSLHKVTFEKFSHDFIERMAPKWRSTKHESQWVSSLTIYAFPIIGKLSLEEITTQHILEILNPIWTSKQVTALRVRGRLERVISAGITSGYRTSNNPAIWKGHLENLLPWLKPSQKHYTAMSYKDVPALMKKLSTNESQSSLALQFTILNALRTSEGLYARKSEINEKILTIPPNRMKGHTEHLVPLSDFSIKLVETASSSNLLNDLIFHNNGSRLSNMAMLMLVRGIQPGMTVHGFRSSFRDWVSEETNYSPEIAEMALAHKIANKVEAAYRRGKLLEKRKQLLLDWEKHCLSLCNT